VVATSKAIVRILISPLLLAEGHRAVNQGSLWF
jgi:hypothetical protein